MSKQFWGVIIIIVLVFVGIFAFTGKKSTDSSSSGSTAGTHHVEGLNQDGVTLTEYGDFECPYCGQYYPIVKQVVAQYNNQIQFQFVNFPLTSIHPNAFAGARAAEAAGLQNKYWQMHDLLYQNQDQWSESSDPTPYFNTYAQQIGLNVNQFKTDFASTKVNDLISADMAKGNKLGITGTPTFYLNGKQIQVNESVSSFQTLLNAAITKSHPNAELPSNTTTNSGTSTGDGNTQQSTGTSTTSGQ